MFLELERFLHDTISTSSSVSCMSSLNMKLRFKSDAVTAALSLTPVDRASDSMVARPKAIHFSWLGPELSSVAWSTRAQLIIFFCFRFSVVLFDRPVIPIRNATHCICRVLVFASS